MRVRGAWLLFLTVVSGACGEGETERWTRVDSAGIEVVLSDPVGLQSPALDRLVSLGTVDEGGATEFFQVRDLELLDGEAFAVANAGSEEVRVFSRDGRLLRSFGNAGRGPEEFLRLSLVEEFGDSILTYDDGNDRIGVRDRQGTLNRTFRLEWVSGILSPVGVSPSGRVLAVTARHMTELNGAGRVVDTALVSMYDLDGTLIDSLIRVPHNERFVKRAGGVQTTLRVPFTQSASLVSTDSGFCYSFGPISEVRCYNQAGTLRQILRVEKDTHPIEDSDIDQYWGQRLEEAEGPYLDALRRVRPDMVFPSHFPAIQNLLVDDAGRIWAQQYQTDQDSESAWWVFEDGHLVAEVMSPAGFQIMDVEGELLGGVWRDELEVEHVQLYRLNWEGSSDSL